MKKLLAAFLILFLLSTISGVYFVFGYRTNKNFEISISRGQSLYSISQTMSEIGVTPHARVFWLYMFATSQQSKVRAGNFLIPQGSNLTNVASLVTRGGQDDYRVTIKPGSRVEEIEGISPSIRQHLIPQIGFLLPETYQIPRNYSASQIKELIKKEFESKYLQLTESSTSTRSQIEIITIASLLEREAKTLTDKRIIAGIIENRLSLGMPLQIDATAQYARDSQQPPVGQNYWRPVTKQQLSVKSPYNTYQNAGLPPGPICNPGLDSISAALNPSSSEYLFYISDTTGKLHYARTLDEHNLNISKYLL